jgi:hypothetical protein
MFRLVILTRIAAYLVNFTAEVIEEVFLGIVSLRRRLPVTI